MALRASDRLVALVFAVTMVGGGGRLAADAVADFHAATRAVDAKEYDKAITLYSRALDSGELNEKQRYVTFAGRAFAYYFDRQHDRALVDFDEAIRLAPDVAEYYAGRGAVYFDMGWHRKALADYEEAVRLKPDYVKAVRARDALRDMLGEDGGKTASPAGQPDRKPSRTIEKRGGEPPQVPADTYGQAIGHLSVGRFDEAIAVLDQVIRLDPRHAPAYVARADAYNGKGQWARAMADAERAFTLDPGNAEARRNMAVAMNGEAWRLATSPDPAERDGRRAVDLASAAVRLHPDEPYVHGNLAAAYAETGRFADAVDAQQRAVDMLVREGRRKEAAAFISRLENYRRNKPHRR